jgi:hypothetical protein
VGNQAIGEGIEVSVTVHFEQVMSRERNNVEVILESTVTIVLDSPLLIAPRQPGDVAYSFL